MTIYKTKTYKVTYKQTGGVDTFSGQYILSQDWLIKMIDNGNATLHNKNYKHEEV